MQFIAKGPDIPDLLLRAQEDGRLVFFCGAGISYPAGLPGFEDLVLEIYKQLGTTRDPIEQVAYKHNQFDATLDLLERRLPGQRIAVRTALASVLTPKLDRKGAMDTHAALLHLARNREDTTRLVTTNFDRIFEQVAKRAKQSVPTFSAPLLPIPKKSSWDGLVYLHGLLPAREDVSALHRLVLTSGDFGSAYLTDRWAARFVGELFRNYVVCFVGYSINDPVLRYMMDALDADRMRGETTHQAFALGACKTGQEKQKTVEWRAKGVEPILYEVPKGSGDHFALHATLQEWAKIFRDGVLGKERIVVDYALARPSASSQQDDFVGRMLWALSHESGLPAKRFAEFNPVPPLEWLKAFSEERYGHGDLDRFGISPRLDTDDTVHFSFVHRPAPYTQAPWMSVVSGGTIDSQLDNVMHHICRWLVRHLNDPTLIIWLANRGGQLNAGLSSLIESELERLARLERERKTVELNEIRANSPNAIPQPQLQILWRLLLTGQVKSSQRNSGLLRWQARLQQHGLTPSLRRELRGLLAPKLKLTKGFRIEESDEEDGSTESLEDLIDWQVVLTTDNVRSRLASLAEVDSWRDNFPSLLDEFQQLLRDALDLFQELGGADEFPCESHWDLPSIDPHSQNRGFHDWVVLIELLRDAWLALRKIDPEQASRRAEGWFALPYVAFKRLALFAASHEGCIPVDKWVEWLAADNSWCLWSTHTQRETMRLFVRQGVQLTGDAREKLETAVLAGPPHEMFVDDIKAERWQFMVDESVWRRLAKLQAGGCALGKTASHHFSSLSAANPEWALSVDGRDEFSYWVGATGDPGFNGGHKIDKAPREWRGLVVWLKQTSPDGWPSRKDDWRETCRTRFFHCFFALRALAQEGLWPVERWRVALQVWSEEGLIRRSWRFAAPLVHDMHPDCLSEIVRDISWWLEAVSKSIERHETILLNLCRQLLEFSHLDGVDTDRPVSRAIIHPIGHITRTLLNLWFNRKPGDNDKLPKDIEPLFTPLCDKTVEQFRHGRVLLGSELIPLFRIDRAWTEEHLLPLLDWNKNHIEAKTVWQGFLTSPRFYMPLMVAFKTQFLNTAAHYEELGEFKHPFASFLTFAALSLIDERSTWDFQSAFKVLPPEGLPYSLEAASQALEAIDEQREDYWKNRIHPFWQHIWPKSRHLASSDIAELLARLCIAARGEFPSAVRSVRHWLQPIEQPDDVVGRLHESGLSVRFPKDALHLLNLLIDNQSWAPREIGQCLAAIARNTPDLKQDPRYQRLMDYARRHGIEMKV